MTTPSPPPTPSSHGKPTILITNDDGICPERALAVPLAAALAQSGLDVTVVAPGRNNSACGQSITLHTSLTLEHHPDLEEQFGPRGGSHGSLRVFSVTEGTPSDCVAVAIEPGTGLLALLGRFARLVVSGVNMGPNLGGDIIYSGTFAGARQAAMYGVPALAASLATWKLDGPGRARMLAAAVDVAVQLAHAALRVLPDAPPHIRRAKPLPRPHGLRQCFARGDVLLNVNVPAEWNGRFAATELDSVLYRDVLRLEGVPEGNSGGVQFCMSGARMEARSSPRSDTFAVTHGMVSVSTLQCWPWSHPFAVPQEIMEKGFLMDEKGLPKWMTSDVLVEGKVGEKVAI